MFDLASTHRRISGILNDDFLRPLVSMSSDGSTRVMDHRTKGRQGGLEGVLEIWWPTVYRFLPPKTGPLYFQEAFRVRTCTTMRMILCLTTHIYRDVSVQFDGTSRSPATDQWWIYFRINCRPPHKKFFKKIRNWYLTVKYRRLTGWPVMVACTNTLKGHLYVYVLY